MNKNNLMYFGLGLGLGAAVAALFAPASGSDTRQMIADTASGHIDLLKSQGQALKTVVTDGVTGTVQRVNDTVQRTKDTVDKAAKTLQYGAQNVSAAVQGAKDAYRESVATTPTV